MAKKETVEKPGSKIRLRMYNDKAVIHRNGGLPSIEDKATEAVVWLERNGFKPEDIEVFGEKPANWDQVFAIAPAVPVEVPVEASPEIVPETVPGVIAVFINPAPDLLQ